MSAPDDVIRVMARAMCEADGKKPDDPAWVRYPGPTYEGIAWEQHVPKAHALLRAAEEAGWRLVPTTLTREMRLAANTVWAQGRPELWSQKLDAIEQAWPVLLAAAPKVGGSDASD